MTIGTKKNSSGNNNNLNNTEIQKRQLPNYQDKDKSCKFEQQPSTTKSLASSVKDEGLCELGPEVKHEPMVLIT